jgi:hypothetical protein
LFDHDRIDGMRSGQAGSDVSAAVDGSTPAEIDATVDGMVDVGLDKRDGNQVDDDSACMDMTSRGQSLLDTFLMRIGVVVWTPFENSPTMRNVLRDAFRRCRGEWNALYDIVVVGAQLVEDWRQITAETQYERANVAVSAAADWQSAIKYLSRNSSVILVGDLEGNPPDGWTTYWRENGECCVLSLVCWLLLCVRDS